MHKLRSWFIDQFTHGNVKDYQMTAWLMAICLNGMTDEETAALTEAMIKSGKELNWSAASTHKVDKHSTAGVGDKVSLILQPLVASFGLTVPSMAGRGLGHTGGTIDKLESIPGFKTQYSAEEFATLVLSSSDDGGEPLNVAIVSPSKDICPADRRMYALRDVTSCVRSLPLQTSSIMCKKIAERPDSLVLDVKFGKGSFNNDVEESLELAKRMIQTGELCGIATTALVTRMDEPLGVAVGNWLEVKECINIMRNYGTEAGDDFSMDLVDVTLALGGQMLVQGSKANTLKEGIAMARENLSNGKAWQKFRQMVIAQGGDISYIDNPEKYPPATYQSNAISPQSGYILSIDSLEIGLTGVLIGAGRKSVEESVDFSAGILFKAKAGKFVNEGDVLAEIYSERSGEVMENAAQRVLKAVTFSEKPPVKVPLITHLVTKNGSTEFDQSNLE
jgi:pyrimidine-nucleoside phosphorylase